MTARINTVGMTKGYLIGVEEQGKYLVVECQCGNVKTILRSNFIAGYTLSCGCLRTERVKAACEKHGMKNTPIYMVWQAMKRRCYNPNNRSYPWYGGKGIKVCERWQDFKSFYDDMGSSYTEGMTLDRIDSSADYSPMNCRWLTKSENASLKGS